MRTLTAALCLSLCFAPAAGDSPLASRRQSTVQTATEKQAWDLLEQGASDHNVDKRSNAIQALGLDIGDTSAVRMAENALSDSAAFVRAAAARALGALGSPDSIPKLQPLLNDKDISVALAACHALVQLKSNSGYDLYYALVIGNRKGSRSLITEELDQMRTPSRAIRFAFDQGIGFIPYGGYGKEALHAWRKRNTAPTRAAAARELADDPDPRTSERSQKLYLTTPGSSAPPPSKPSLSGAIPPFLPISCQLCPIKKTSYAIRPLLLSCGSAALPKKVPLRVDIT